MTLSELGLHKTAGAQADAYRLIKPIVSKMLNTRNAQDVVDLANYQKSQRMLGLVNKFNKSITAKNKQSAESIVMNLSGAASKDRKYLGQLTTFMRNKKLMQKLENIGV
jgi:hypothetical protein